jgi:hypothetical protein
MAIDQRDLENWTDTKAHRRAFYCWSTTVFLQDQAMYWSLVRVFRHDPKKRYASFINDWFIEGNIPEDMQAKGYMSKFNTSAERSGNISANVQVANRTKTFAGKMQAAGGGVGGFFKALKVKLTTDTKLPTNIFDSTIRDLTEMFGDARHNFQRNQQYQPNGAFADQVQGLKKYLTEAGFDADDIGVY